MIKTLSKYFAFAAIVLAPSLAHAFSPVRYVQISTNTLNRQTGTAVVAGINASTMTITSSATVRAPIDMSSNKITGLANGTATGDAAAYNQLTYKTSPAQTTTETSFTTSSSTTFQTTNLSASITPSSASNRIKITVSGGTQVGPTLGAELYITLFRGSTDLGSASGTGLAVVRNAASQTFRSPVSFAYIDSPATTSSTTYSVRIRNNDGATTVGGFASPDLEKNVIILEEIAP